MKTRRAKKHAKSPRKQKEHPYKLKPREDPRWVILETVPLEFDLSVSGGGRAQMVMRTGIWSGRDLAGIAAEEGLRLKGREFAIMPLNAAAEDVLREALSGQKP